MGHSVDTMQKIVLSLGVGRDISSYNNVYSNSTGLNLRNRTGWFTMRLSCTTTPACRKNPVNIHRA